MGVGTPRDATGGQQKAASAIIADAVEQLRGLGYTVSYELEARKNGRLNLYAVARLSPPPAWKLVEALIESTNPDRENE